MHPNDGRVVSNFIVQILLSRDITIFGDGTQTCSFCHVDDLIDALARLMDIPNDVIGPVDLANPTKFSMLQLAKKMVDLTGSSSPIVRRAPVNDDPRQCPNISRERFTVVETNHSAWG
jgi:UDP-glucuronate decarboxylase